MVALKMVTDKPCHLLKVNLSSSNLITQNDAKRQPRSYHHDFSKFQQYQWLRHVYYEFATARKINFLYMKSASIVYKTSCTFAHCTLQWYCIMYAEDTVRLVFSAQMECSPSRTRGMKL